MKKNNIFRHELNESIQANAAMNCLKNRNNHKQINEVAPVVAAAGRMLLPMLRPVITKLVQKALVKIGNHARPTEILKLVMGMLTKGEFAKKIAEKCGQTWNEIPSEVKKEIQNAIIDAFKAQSPQEQEEEDYTNDEIPSPNFSYRMSFIVWAMREIIPYLREISQVCAQADPTELKHAVMKILKTRDTGIPETHHSCEQWAKENYDWVEMELNGEYDAYQEKWSRPFNIPSEQEESDYDEDDYVPYENKFDETHHDIVDSILDEVYLYFRFETDVEGFKLKEYTEEQIGKAIEQILDKTGDFPSSVTNNVCYAWVKKHAGEIIKVLETGSLENTYEGHPEFDFSEQEELPQMERKDMILALSEYMSESWIDTGDDGDLDDIYYAIADILDETGDYPASTDWEDCKPWCQKHYKEIEAKIY